MTLSAVRYVIAVSLEALKVPLQDVVDNGVTYRQIISWQTASRY